MFIAKALQPKVPEPMYQGSRTIAHMVTCFQEFIDKRSAALAAVSSAIVVRVTKYR